MRSNSLKALALAEIFIMLTVCPINAYRVTQAGNDMADLESTQEVVQALRDALAEDAAQGTAANGTQDYFGESWASCNQRKHDFERRTQKLKTRYEEAAEDGKISLKEAAWVVLKARTVAKTVQKGQSKGCAWAKDKEAAQHLDMSALKGLQKELAPKTPCYDATIAKLERAKNKDETSQKKAVVAALSGYLSKDCKAPSHRNATEVAKALAVSDGEAEEDATDLATQAGDVEAEGLAEMDGEMNKLKFAMLQLGDDLSASAGEEGGEKFITALATFVAMAIGFIILVILLAFLCAIAVAIFLLVLGLIMCLLKMFIVALLRLFGNDIWDFDFSGCLEWWLTPLETSPGDPALALCVVALMSGGMH